MIRKCIIGIYGFVLYNIHYCILSLDSIPFVLLAIESTSNTIYNPAITNIDRTDRLSSNKRRKRRKRREKQWKHCSPKVNRLPHQNQRMSSKQPLQNQQPLLLLQLQ